MNTSYQFGIEEEYFLADATTRGTPRRTVKAFHDAARARLPQVAEWVEAASHPALMDTTRARTELGWEPQWSAIEALRDTVRR